MLFRSGDFAADVQERDPRSTLSLYRQALRMRRELQCEEQLEWGPLTSPTVLDFIRPNGWRCITNFGSATVALPKCDVVLASAQIADDELPVNASAWLRA